MTIEYTYPEQRPTKATVSSKTMRGAYWIDIAPNPEWLTVNVPDGGGVHRDDVPEVCEAMMRLAGHEYPSAAAAIARLDVDKQFVEKAVGKRIIARLEKEQVSHSSYKYGLEHAARVIREECGL